MSTKTNTSPCSHLHDESIKELLQFHCDIKKSSAAPTPHGHGTAVVLSVLVMLKWEAFNRRHTNTYSINSSLQSSRRMLCTNICFFVVVGKPMQKVNT